MRFGQFEINIRDRKLVLQGRPVALGERAMDVLLVLIRLRHRVVLKTELLELIWGDVLIDESNVHMQIWTLRKLIGDGAILTVASRGYRFVAPILTATRGPRRLGIATPALCIPSQIPLAGRDVDRSALDALVRRHRMVTMTGPGGVGKTALALTLVHGWMRESWHAVWIDMANVPAHKDLGEVIAKKIRWPLGSLYQAPGGLRKLASSRETLVVLDSADRDMTRICEALRDVLQAPGNLRFLVTSQAATKLDGERIYRVGVLDTPAAACKIQEAHAFGAIALFVREAKACIASFTLNAANLDDVMAICRAIDGLPLAIKLAARCVPALGLPGLRARIERRMDLGRARSRPGSLYRRTLRDIWARSYQQLPDAEKYLFRRLGAMQGEFTLKCACAAAAHIDQWDLTEQLSCLIDHSLVLADCSDPPRFRLLESARYYAATVELDSA